MTIVTSPTISLIITPSVSALPPGRVLVSLFSFYFLTPYSCVLTPWSYLLTSHKCVHGLARFSCPACDLGSYCSSSHPKYFTTPCLKFIFKYIYIFLLQRVQTHTEITCVLIFSSKHLQLKYPQAHFVCEVYFFSCFLRSSSLSSPSFFLMSSNVS